MKRYLLTSILLHSLACLGLRSDSISLPRRDVLTVAVIASQGRRSPGPRSKPRLKGGYLSNAEPYDGDLGERATADNYVERIRALVEPPWRILVAERVRILRREGKSYQCETCVDADMDPSGTVSETRIVRTCSDDVLTATARAAIGQRLYPPPKTFLKNGLLTLNWCFYVR